MTPPLTDRLTAALPKPPTRTGDVFLALFGVALPVACLAVELTTRMCADVLFDPLPTPFHVVLVALVPVVLTLAFQARRDARRVAPEERPTRREERLPLLLGIVLAVTLVYALPFLPWLPIAVIAIIGGIGLLAFGPLLAFVLTFREVRRLRWIPGAKRRVAIAFAATLALLAVLEAPKLLMWMAKGDHPLGVRGLRWLGAEDDLLERPDGRQAMSVLRGMEAQQVYYRVTGKAPIAPRFGDIFQGTTQVGFELEDLFLETSQVDFDVHAAAALGTFDWTLVFRNDRQFDAEARANVVLPDGAVVSGVLLWIDGVPHQAAFGGKAQTRAAYERVVRRQRDPLLVTAQPDGTVLVQCFPVPPGGTMRIRLEITFPLQVRGPSEASFRLPLLAQRNFGLDDGVELPSAEPILVKRPPGLPVVAFGHEDAEGGWMVARPEEQPRRTPRPVVVVLDGSVGMEEHRGTLEEIFEILDGMSDDVTVLLASDVVERYDGEPSWRDWLAGVRFVGGQKHAKALLQADAVAADGEADLLYVTAPRPFDVEGNLLSLLTVRSSRVVALRLGVGRHELLDETTIRPSVVHVPVSTDPVGALRRVLVGGGRDWSFDEAPEVPPSAVTSEKLRPLWAADRVQERGEKAVELAVRHRIVTPVSGAVVLENQEQYEAAGLDPGGPASIPTVPEPETWALLAVALLALAVARRAGWL